MVLQRVRLVGTDHHAAGLHEVLDRGALAQELGVGHHRERQLAGIAPHQLALHDLAHTIGGAHRRRALADDQCVMLQACADLARHRQHVADVGCAVPAARRAHCDELDRAVCHRRIRVGGEHQAAAPAVANDQVFEARLMERQAAAVQLRDTRRVGVHAHHVVHQLGQARRRHQADIAGAVHRDRCTGGVAVERRCGVFCVGV
jgi:hypothetical protein